MNGGQLKQPCGERRERASEKIKALVVDDSLFVLEGISHLMRKIPAVQITGKASDGGEAVHLAVATRPDLVLMDFQMPKMDGLTAARLIREAHPVVKIILITAHDLEKVRRNTFFPQVDEILCKQELPSNLPKAIRSMFPDRYIEADGKDRH